MSTLYAIALNDNRNQTELGLGLYISKVGYSDFHAVVENKAVQ